MTNTFSSPLVSSFPLLLSGLWMTAKLWIGSSTIALIVGGFLGIIACEKLQTKLISRIVSFYVFVIRGIPMYVHVLIVYFVLPDLIGINVSSVVAAILGLSIYFSAYITEIVRCGINSIPQGQWDACFVLGYTQFNTLIYIILPQMLYRILPALANELDALIKSTAVLSTIGVLELTKAGNNIVARYMNPVPVYATVAGLYLTLSLLLNIATRVITRRTRYDKR